VIEASGVNTLSTTACISKYWNAGAADLARSGQHRRERYLNARDRPRLSLLWPRSPSPFAPMGE
jgi:hypothetical protein